MDNEVKTGKQVVDDFFQTMENIEDIDKHIAKKIREVYNQQERLTDKILQNILDEMLEEELRSDEVTNAKD